MSEGVVEGNLCEHTRVFCARTSCIVVRYASSVAKRCKASCQNDIKHSLCFAFLDRMETKYVFCCG